MKNVIFVDDEPNVLNGLARQLHHMRGEWQMAFASSGMKALELMETTPFDVVVTDMRMPGIGGSQLLAQVSKRFPQMIRIVLSGMCDREAALSSVAGAHQFLSKPCDVNLLKSSVERAFAVQADLASGALKRFIARVVALPSLPSIYMDLVEAAQDPNASAHKLGKILSQDVAMTSKVLHVVNSPLFGIRRTILNPADACVFLGTDTIRTLVLSVGVFSQFKRKGRFSAEALQTHSLSTADLARRIAKLEQLPRDTVEECFLAGMLHDVGKLVMAVNCPSEYEHCIETAEASGRPLAEVEPEVFGITHADAGMYLLRLWGLSEAVTAAVALHHRPALSPDTSLGALPIVHVANVLDRDSEASTSAFDLEYLARINAMESLPAWQELARKTAEQTTNSSDDSEALKQKTSLTNV
ncbi:MAG TPA: response regulator [Bryobacteraceae bacterium]|nr:response regulator [Bryobacteraceae bacterium]